MKSTAHKAVTTSLENVWPLKTSQQSIYGEPALALMELLRWESRAASQKISNTTSKAEEIESEGKSEQNARKIWTNKELVEGVEQQDTSSSIISFSQGFPGTLFLLLLLLQQPSPPHDL